MILKNFSTSIVLVLMFIWTGMAQIDKFGRDISSGKRLAAPVDQASQTANQSTSSTIKFSPYIDYSVGSSAELAGIGDIDGNGWNDVVVVTTSYNDPANDYSIFIFYNFDGQLQAPTKTSYPGSPNNWARTLHLVDLDKDGQDEIILGYADSIVVYKYQNQSLKKLFSSYSGVAVDGVFGADVSSDGRCDIIVSHWSSDFVRIFYQQNGQFDSSVTLAVNQGGFDQILAADVSGDNKNDIIFMRGQYFTENAILIWEQQENGFALPYHIGGQKFVRGIASGDFNNDGHIDLVATQSQNQPESYLIVWHQQEGQLKEPTFYPAYDIPEAIVAADFDLDGDDDLFVLHGGWMKASIYQQAGDSLLPYTTLSIPYASHYSPQGLAAGDLNGDRLPDIAFADYNKGLIILYNQTDITNINTEKNRTTNPENFILYPNYPNPFNLETTISFYLPTTTKVKVDIYNSTGQKIKTLINQLLPKGNHQIRFNAQNLPSGIYFYSLAIKDFYHTKKMILIK